MSGDDRMRPESSFVEHLPILLKIMRPMEKVFPPPEAEDGEWSPPLEAQKHVDAAALLESTLERWLRWLRSPAGKAFSQGEKDELEEALLDSQGANDELEEQLLQSLRWLGILRQHFEGLKEMAEELERDFAAYGIYLDPRRPGGGSFRSGGRGAPQSLLSAHVWLLLRSRCEDWDGSPPFPGRNDQELRDWLHGKLVPGPFPGEHVDPSPGGALYRIVNNFQRLQ